MFVFFNHFTRTSILSNIHTAFFAFQILSVKQSVILVFPVYVTYGSMLVVLCCCCWFLLLSGTRLLKFYCCCNLLKALNIGSGDLIGSIENLIRFSFVLMNIDLILLNLYTYSLTHDDFSLGANWGAFNETRLSSSMVIF